VKWSPGTRRLRRHDFTFGDAQGLFHFYSDMNGDRRIDISDFGQFSLTYNRFSGDPAFNSAFDFNGDGRKLTPE
jgi:hypothetical protein